MPYSDGARQLDVTKRVLSPSAAPRLRWQEEGARDGRNNRVELDRPPTVVMRKAPGADCKRIRNGQSYWQQIEAYIRERSETTFSHSVCPNCREQVVEPELKKWRERSKQIQ